jgi:hypothetical protein
MITVLKGSPQYSIDNNGVMTITTTWMVMPDNKTDGTSAVNWLAFETEVETWAGNVGDAYKKPVIPENGKEATAYTETEAFIVSDISYSCVDGRTHYEVTFTNEQNSTVMRMVGNVSAEINESNEKTKTVNYIINVASDDPLAIDSSFIFSGTTVDWAGTDYQVSSSSYNAVSKTRYELSITAQDMSVMMLGNPSKSTDAFGQHTMSATWRYSTSAYNEWVQPLEGSDASAYLGLPEGSGYLVTEVSAEPNGVLGYTITINAKHVSKRLVKVSKQESRKSSGSGFYTTHNIQYQSDADSVGDFTGLVGIQASEFIEDAVGRITEVSVDESGRNDYDVQITTTDEPQSSEDNSKELQEQVDVSMSQSEFVLDAKQAGWFQGLSGEFYTINNPPTTMFSYTVSPSSLQSMYSGSKGGTLSSAELLDAIKAKSTIVYDNIVGVQAYVANRLKWLSDQERQRLTNLDNVQSIRLEGFVYAQPTMTVKGESLRNLLFEAWERRKHCPIYMDNGEYKDRDVALDKTFLTYKIQVMDISVSKYYRGKSSSVLKTSFDTFYSNAIKYIKSKAFTSYKGVGISISEVTDEDDTTWTQVTCSISALLSSNIGGIVWNSEYDNSYVE